MRAYPLLGHAVAIGMRDQRGRFGDGLFAGEKSHAWGVVQRERTQGDGERGDALG
jgi:hypothetical protein